MMPTSLVNRRIFVVEDEMLIAILVEEALESLGCVVVGPVGRLDDAVRMAREEAIDAAILDVTIRGGAVFPVAEVLLEREIPFVFASGYGAWALPDSFRGQPQLNKPFTSDDIAQALQKLAA